MERLRKPPIGLVVTAVLALLASLGTMVSPAASDSAAATANAGRGPESVAGVKAQPTTRDRLALAESTGPALVIVSTRAASPSNAADGKRVDVVGRGLGFVVDATGHILTARHVIEGAGSVTVQFADGSKMGAKIVGEDRTRDLAVLKVAKCHLTAMSLGDSGRLRGGAGVLSVAYCEQNGFHSAITLLEGTVTDLHQRLSPPGVDVMLISGALAPGLSGGPVLDFSGKVVGITIAVSAPVGSKPNAAHVVVPIAAARHVLSEALKRALK